MSEDKIENFFHAADEFLNPFTTDDEAERLESEVEEIINQ